ncbi:unnamed protein product [Candida parapsilosis]
MGAEVGRGNRNEKYYDTEEFSDLDEDDEEVELSQEEEEEGDDFEDGNINEFDRPLSYGNDDDDDDSKEPDHKDSPKVTQHQTKIPKVANNETPQPQAADEENQQPKPAKDPQ